MKLVIVWMVDQTMALLVIAGLVIWNFLGGDE